MDIRIEPIGHTSDGIDGKDEYLLLTRTDDTILTPEQARDWLLPQVSRNAFSQIAGGYYCLSVRAVQVEFSRRSVICTVEHRWDV